MIAVMMLTWRTLYPIKAVYLYFPRLIQIKKSIRQLNALMNIHSEDEESIITFKKIPQIKGDVILTQVGFRYPTAIHPTLLNINAHFKMGELIALTGANGSGKTTLLKLLLGTYMPQVGTIYIDGMDLRQFDLINYRKTVAYSGQVSELFHGTIEQNLRLANPTVTHEQIIVATKAAGIYDMIESLDGGFGAHLPSQARFYLPQSFRFGLCLARAYLKNASLILLDEPVGNFDKVFEKYFLDALNRLRGKSTIIMCTHQPSLMQIADKIMVLDRGHIQHFGLTQQVMKKTRQKNNEKTK